MISLVLNNLQLFIQFQVIDRYILNKYIFDLMTTWYGKSASKQLESFLEGKPKLHQLFSVPQFAQELKAYNTKLLDYITNTPALIAEAIQYITVAPSEYDSNDRKFKLPLQTIEMIETQTTCVLNGFFKDVDGRINFDALFDLLRAQSLLPLLVGYFFRANLILLNNRYKQSLDRVYGSSRMLQDLINHAQHMAISNTIQLYLNQDVNKSQNSNPQRLAIKLETIRSIVKKIEKQGKYRNSDSAAIVENLVSVLIQTIDKYYLILDGKQMMDVITEYTTINVMMNLIRDPSDCTPPALGFFISLINYYSFSSFNGEDSSSPQNAKKLQQRLENQPMIIELNAYFSVALEKVMTASTISLHTYKLLQIFCHCISISSMKIFKKICQTRFFACLINLLFKHEKNNILHMLIQKSFYHIFISERKIYEEYKKHLFCDLDIIDLTVNRVLKMFPEDRFYQSIKKKAYFGHFMRILKIYSGIQPTDDNIILAIKSKTFVWNKISQILIKPYEAICFKELGSYQNVPPSVIQQFTIKKSTNITPVADSSKNSTAILEIEREEQFPISPETKSKEDHAKVSLMLNSPEISVVPKIQQHLPQVELPQPEKLQKKSESYKQFMTKKKVEAEQQIKMKRSMSQDKKLSNNSRGKMTSPSPNKKNSWRQDNSQNTSITSNVSTRSFVEQSNIPSSKSQPSHRRNNGPANLERQNRFVTSHNEQKASSLPHSIPKSVNMDEIKKIKVIQIDLPREKKFRRADEKDRMFLDFLGIST